MADEVSALVATLHDSMSPDATQRWQSERLLEQREKLPGYLPLLMQLMRHSELGLMVQQQAAITFKNAVKRLWGQTADDAAAQPLLSAEDVAAVKTQIVDLMLATPDAVQRQLSEAISAIAAVDFPQNWGELLPSLAAKLAAPDFHTINGVLRTANPLFQHYRIRERSDELWTEIKYVLDIFAQPLTTLFKSTLQLLSTTTDANALRVIFNSIELMCDIFYSLNYQDLPAFFQDHAEEWMDNFALLLALPDNPALANDDSEKPGAMELVKTQICINLTLYAKKYDEDFETFQERFAGIVWTLLTTTGTDVRFDALACAAMQFLAVMAEREKNQVIFGNEDTLRAICEHVVTPNLQFRDVDMEIFESDPEEYILRDMEGADVETRRRAAVDLIRALCKFWEDQVTRVFSTHVATLLQRYAANPSSEWRSKDAAETLVTAVATRKKTAALGATEINPVVDVVDFFKTSVLPDLQGDNINTLPVLRSNAMKYLLNFRQQIPDELHFALIPLLVRHLGASSVVVSSYAACTLERQLIMRRAGTPVITKAVLEPQLGPILEGLFGALARPDNVENEYMMKAIMRTLAAAHESVLPYLPVVVERLSQILMMVARNPNKPRFNHFLFEAFAAAIRFTCSKDETHVASFEAALFPPFGLLLQSDVLEFQPYVFQLLAEMLELRNTPPLPEAYMSLFPFLLQPTLWESGANTIPLTRLLLAYVALGKDSLFPEPTEITKLLGVFRKLIASRTYDTEGFKLITCIMDNMSTSLLQQYIPTVLNLLLMRMQSGRTSKYVQAFFVFTTFLAGKFGGSYVVTTLDGIQPQLFGMLMNRLLEEAEKDMSLTPVRRKTCIVGLTSLLTATPELLANYASFWPRLLMVALKLAVRAGDAATGGVDIEAEDVDPDLEGAGGGYRATYAQLTFAVQKEFDPFPSVANVGEQALVQQLHAYAASHPGQIGPMVPAEAQPVLNSMLQATGLGPLA